MSFALQLCLWALSFPLQFLCITALLRGSYRRLPLVLLCLVANFLISVVEIPKTLAFLQSQRKLASELGNLYYFDDILWQVLIFAVVISLIYEATARMSSRRLLRLALVGGPVLAITISFVFHYNPRAALGIWITPWLRDLKFCAVILDLALWALLVGLRKKDRLVLLLSGAMGILFAGEAIGVSLRELATPQKIVWLSRLGGLLINISNLVWLYIWWKAFRSDAAANANPRAA